MRIMNKRILALVLALLLLVPVFASAEADEEKVLNIAIAGAVQNLDPYLLNTMNANYALNQIGDTLVRMNADGTVRPYLATEWTISDDGTEYIFTIRDDVYFHPGEFQDGRLMTADDVAWCLNRCRDNYTGYMNMLEEAEAIDDTHVKCTLYAPSSLFLLNLRQNLCVIVPPEEVEGQGDAFNSNVIATGPFMLVSHDPDVQTVMVANPNYWGGKPNVDKIVISVIPDINQRVFALMSGEIDIAGTITGEAIQTLDQSENCATDKQLTPNITTIGMNTSNEILSDERVREAIIMATDYDVLFRGTYLYGEAEPTRVLVPQSSWCYSDALLDYIPEYDPAAAKELLTEAGYPNGFSITLSMTQSETLTRAATIFQQLMKQNLNIDVQLEYLESASRIEKMIDGSIEMWMVVQYYENDPANFYGLSFASSQLSSNYNSWKFSDPEVDALIEQAGQESDQDVRLQLYNQIAEIVLPQDMGIWFATEASVVGYNKCVEGFGIESAGGLYVCDDHFNFSVVR